MLEREKQKAAGLAAELQKVQLLDGVPAAGTDPKVSVLHAISWCCLVVFTASAQFNACCAPLCGHFYPQQQISGLTDHWLVDAFCLLSSPRNAGWLCRAQRRPAGQLWRRQLQLQRRRRRSVPAGSPSTRLLWSAPTSWRSRWVGLKHGWH